MAVAENACEHLVILVGGNPLPGYLSAKTLAPRKITLLHSGESQQLAEQLKVDIEAKLETTPELMHIKDPHSARAVAEAWRNIPGIETDPKTVFLDYTGGTKVMSVHAGADLGLTVYASDAKGGLLLVDSDGNERVIYFPNDGPLFDLELLLSLHGRKRSNLESGTWRDTATIVNAWTEHRERCHDFQSLHEDPDTAMVAQDSPCRPVIDALCEREGITITRATITRVRKFCAGEWLETWLAKILAAHLPTGKVHRSVECYKPRPGETPNSCAKFEFDVAAIVGSRFYGVSCTTDDESLHPKRKGLEMLLRAQQIGGDFARVALLTFLSRANANTLKSELADFWDSPVAPQVFGWDDFIAWEKGDLKTLKEWMPELDWTLANGENS